MNPQTQKAFVLASVVAAALTVSACNRNDDGRTAGQKVDSSMESAEQRTESARADASRTIDQVEQSASGAATSAGRSVNEGMNSATQSATNAAQSATSAVSDSTTTAAVKAKLAADTRVKATDIDVDTSGGRVTLQGTVPNEAARSVATELASSVNGVASVDNKLNVGGKP